MLNFQEESGKIIRWSYYNLLGKGLVFMIGKELKRLSRRELVDIIYQLKKNEQKKQEEIAALEEELQEKRIRISVAGSIAEAAMDITQIFSTAQRTADLYLHEIASIKKETEEACAKKIEEANKQAEMILANARNQRG